MPSESESAKKRKEEWSRVQVDLRQYGCPVVVCTPDPSGFERNERDIPNQDGDILGGDGDPGPDSDDFPFGLCSDVDTEPQEGGLE